jgi:hypothetical protein
MKNILTLIFCLFLSTGSVSLFAQANQVKIGSPNVTAVVLGGLQADSAFRVPFLPKNYNYTKGQTTFRQVILATEDTSLWINKGSAQFQIFDQSDTNTTYGPTTPYYVNRQINKIIDDSTLNVKVLGFGLDRADSILFVDTPTVLTVNKAAQTYVPNTGAAYNVDLGTKTLTAGALYTDTVQAKPAQNLHLHGPGGSGIKIGGSAGSNITFDSYTIKVAGDSVLTTDSTGKMARYNLKGKLALYPLYTDTTLSVTIPSSYQVDSAKKNIRSTIAAGSVGAVTSALNGQFLYKSGDTLRGATNVRVDSVDKRLVLSQSDTTQPAVSLAGVKVYSDYYFGRGGLNVLDTTDIYTTTQEYLGNKQFGVVMPGSAAVPLTTLGTYVNNIGTGVVSVTTVNPASYDASVALSNFSRVTYRTVAVASSGAIVRVNSNLVSPGILVGNSKYIGGGKFCARFGVPNYNVGHRYFYGMHEVLSGTAYIEDPSAKTNCIGFGKDAGDATWYIFTRGASVTGNKINTGITPNVNYAYRVTITVPPRGNIAYFVIDEIVSPNTINTYRYTVTTLLPVQTRIYSQMWTSTVATSIATSICLIEMSEQTN